MGGRVGCAPPSGILDSRSHHACHGNELSESMTIYQYTIMARNNSMLTTSALRCRMMICCAHCNIPRTNLCPVHACGSELSKARKGSQYSHLALLCTLRYIEDLFSDVNPSYACIHTNKRTFTCSLRPLSSIDTIPSLDWPTRCSSNRFFPLSSSPAHRGHNSIYYVSELFNPPATVSLNTPRSPSRLESIVEP